tara:strand:+ start:430 stop:615 length:186 start_codon:yes stop_codon:yes gene_type:complete
MKTEEYYDDLLAKISSIQSNDPSDPVMKENPPQREDYYKHIDDLHCKLDDCINNLKSKRAV